MMEVLDNIVMIYGSTECPFARKVVFGIKEHTIGLTQYQI